MVFAGLGPTCPTQNGASGADMLRACAAGEIMGIHEWTDCRGGCGLIFPDEVACGPGRPFSVGWHWRTR